MYRDADVEARLDLSCYGGEDLYSDGEIEDRLLEIVKTYPLTAYNQLLKDENSWPILYHLFNLRENVLNWYPFRKTDEVLEIGAGCGAVTGAFAGKVKSVTCVELSKKRSLINAYKNRQFSNLRIMVGNFEDVEAEALGQYDVITLIGVLEYARYYIHADQPFQSLLQRVAKHLKPDGRIIIAIENRLGLKYWAGCVEDHTLGGYYEGIEGYPHQNGPQTFSRKELLKLIESAGDFKTELYYPHPDYKFPVTMFSDQRLPRLGELKPKWKRNFDQKRVTSFDEDAVFDSLIENDLYPEFANSFIAIIRNGNTAGAQEEAATEKRLCPVLNVKFSNERVADHAIITLFSHNPDGELVVSKQTCDSAGEAHLSHIEQSYRKLKKKFSGTGFELNHCEKTTEQEIRFEYIRSDRTLADHLNELLRNNKRDQLIDGIMEYIETLRTVCTEKQFVPSCEFQKIFGEYVPSREREAVFEEVCDIDLTFDNVLLTGNDKTIIDYEWTFDFDIPLNYVAWRAVFLYFDNKGTAAYKPLEEEIYRNLGITDQDRLQYYEMEKRFFSYAKGAYNSLDDLYEQMTPGFIDVKSVMKNEPLEIRPVGLPQADKKEINMLNQKIEYQKEQIAAIYHSTSWKITRPIRWALDRIRGQEHRG